MIGATLFHVAVIAVAAIAAMWAVSRVRSDPWFSVPCLLVAGFVVLTATGRLFDLLG